MSPQPPRTYEFGVFCLDVREHRLLRDGKPVPLTPKLFQLLRLLVENAGHLVAKERLIEEVWSDAFVEEANLSRGISVLRKTLGESSGERYIETVPKCGYRFVAPVRQSSTENATADPDVRAPDAPDRSASEKPPVHPWRSRLPLGVAAGAILTSLAIVYAVLGRTQPNDHLVSTSESTHRQLTFTGRELTPTLSPDGTRIAYVSNDAPIRRVMVQDLAGGPAVEIFGAPEAGWLRWSPDGKDLMFRARGQGTDGLYVAPVSGRGVRRIAGGGSSVACWSPDSSTIAIALFVKGNIAFVSRLGGDRRFIAIQETRAEGWVSDLDWSGVHGRLLFVRSDDEQHPTIWTIRADGSDQKRIISTTTEILAARWTPSGEAIYYFGRVNQTVSLYKVPVDGEGRTADEAPVPLLSGLETDEGFGLSADATRLVYARAPYYSNLWLVELLDDNGRIRQTPLTQGTGVIERPRVSPDGSSILFSMGYESRANLYTMPATGGPPKQLTFLNAFSIGGIWSPDGRQVAFASNEGGKSRLWLVNADGSSPHPLPTGEMSDSYDMTWAPGSYLLYQQTQNRNYYLVDPRTWRQRLLVEDSSAGWIFTPVYSPDGNRIAVGWNRPPDRGISVIDRESLRETPVHNVHRDSEALPIAWSPDGTSIYAFDGKRAAYRGVSVPFELTVTEARIVRIPLDGSEPETILLLPFEEVGSVTAFPDGRRFVCTVYTSRSDIWIVENFDLPAESRTARRTRTTTH